MLWSRQKPFFTSDYMGYTHQVVIDNVGKVVSWEIVAFHDNLIINCVIVENHFSVDKISKFSFSIGYKHSYSVWLATVNSFCNFLRIKTVAKSVIFDNLIFGATLQQPHLLKPIICAKTVISMTFLKQNVYKFLVNMNPLRLKIRTIIASNLRIGSLIIL